MTSMERNPASFRDPSGFVYWRDGKLFRAITPYGKNDFETFTRSGLAAELMEGRKIVRFQEVPSLDGNTGIELEELRFITYPYEWSFSQLRDAALLTLELTLAALEHNMILQDATAFNIAFASGRPVFMDHGSFVAYREGKPWQAYRQFVMHFLAPLLLMKYVDLKCLAFFRTHLEGIPLDFASRLLPWHTRLRLDPLIHIHLHARLEKRFSSSAAGSGEAQMSRGKLRNLLCELQNHLASLEIPKQKTEWVDYYDDNNYAADSFRFKEETVERICCRVSPRTTVDLGANTGVFSEIAARHSREVIAADIDPQAVERLYRLSRTRCPNIIPMLQDLNNPSPGTGLFNRERSGFHHRCRGELVLGLALMHHLRVSGNWPLGHIVELFADMTSEAALAEFVPKSDSQARRLLRSRDDIYDDWTLDRVAEAFQQRFLICNRIPVPNSDRVLLELYR